jgi:hypothetical protein
VNRLLKLAVDRYPTRDLTPRLWAQAADEARRTREQGSAAHLFVTGVRSALKPTDHSADDRIVSITALLADLDAGRLRPKTIAARQRKILAGQGAQIRPLLKILLALDLRSREADRGLSSSESGDKRLVSNSRE